MFRRDIDGSRNFGLSTTRLGQQPSNVRRMNVVRFNLSFIRFVLTFQKWKLRDEMSVKTEAMKNTVKDPDITDFVNLV